MAGRISTPARLAPLPPLPPQEQPLVPLDIADGPTQRSYAISVIAMAQSVKLHDLIFYRSQRSFIKWALIDCLWIFLLPLLRIPRLTFGGRSKLSLLVLFLSLNVIVFGLIPTGFFAALSVFPSWMDVKHFAGGGPDISTEERHVWAHDVIDGHGHLQGQHTVRLSPISTAQLNPSHLSFCLSPPHNQVLIPILLNNSHPSVISYSLSPLGTKSTKRTFKLSQKDITRLDKEWREYYDDVRAPIEGSDAYDDEYENQLKEEGQGFLGWLIPTTNSKTVPTPKRPLSPQQRAFYSLPLQHTQSLAHISVSRPGVVRLESAQSGSTEFRVGGSDVTVVACPTARFEVPKTAKPRVCVGDASQGEGWAIVAEGVAPLKLKWHKDVNGRRENFVAEGIEGDPDATNIPLAQNITIPIPLSTNTLGYQQYGIDSLIDGAGNTFDPILSPRTDATFRTLEVVGRASGLFKACNSNLLRGGQTTMTIGGDSIAKATVEYVPAHGFSAAPYTRDYATRPGQGDLEIKAAQPGTYTIVRVDGVECPGDILSPETCKVVEQPLPRADVKLESIHECSGDVGVKASIGLHGTPPFKIHYTQQKGREKARVLSKVIQSSRDEIILQPESSGTYTYAFTHVSDRNYKEVPLKGDGLSIKQVVHPLASAAFLGAGGRKPVLSSCSGSDVEVVVDVAGTAPWTVELQVAGPSSTEILRFSNLTNPRNRFQVPIPVDVDVEGGVFQVDLVSVVDANGCKRSLSVPGVTVNVQRVRPTARFYSHDGTRHTIIRHGEEAPLPLRLTGEGPWELKYRLESKPQDIHAKRLSSVNEYLRVSEGGLYELIEIRDAHCPGSIVPLEGTYKVDLIPRPTVRFAPSAGSAARNDSIIRPPVCEGTDDHAEIHLTGRAPYQIAYSYSAVLDHGLQRRDQSTFNSVQPSARLQLRTDVAGHHRYHLTDVGDGSYPIQSGNYGSQPTLGSLLEQDVMVRPTAFFKDSERLSYCVGDSFTAHHNHGVVALRGRPPFVMELSLKNFATTQEAKTTITTNSHEWPMNIPSHHFDTIGPTLVTIESLKDSSSCEELVSDLSTRMLWVDVAETAAIVPFDHRHDYCVGQPISFQLEGTPPWTIEYMFNKKLTHVTSSTSKFTRVPTAAGIFQVLSIAHQRNMCQTSLNGLNVTVHDIPSAKVSHGYRRDDTIKEGDQATITFDLIGTPPFTFTYQRTELARPDRKGKPLQVMETHTVSGVTSHSYTISSSSEGTWTVTFIADKYCRYPANPPDLSIESA